MFEIRSHILLYALYFSLVVQFSRIISPPPFRGDLVIIPQPFSFVNTFFKSFFNFFQGFSNSLRSLYSAPRSRGMLVYSTTIPLICQALFLIFFVFFSFLSLCPVLYDNLYDIVGKKSTNYTKIPFHLPNSRFNLW